VATLSLDFAQIYEAYHGKVQAYAAKLLDPDAAADVSQEVFKKVSQSLATLADPEKLAGWIFAITLNAVRDAARKRASSPRPDARSREEDASADPAARIPDTASRTPEETAMHSEMVACYLDYVKQLPPPYYDVYVLSELEDLSNPEIARRLSLPVGTVKIRLHRARAKLNEQLRENCRCFYTEHGELLGDRKGSA
jgi:RNA polymerase sigma-70 factor, ECF subfamily